MLFIKTENFTRSELACKCCNFLPLTDEVKDSINSLQDTRTEFGELMIVNCGSRCITRNNELVLTKKASKNSRHLKIAFDISTNGWDIEKKKRFVKIAFNNGFIGIGVYNTFIHIDKGFELTHNRNWNYGTTDEANELHEYVKEIMGE